MPQPSDLRLCGNLRREHGTRDARKLAELLSGLRAKVTLIDVNDDSGRYQPPTDDEVREFRDELLALTFPCPPYAGGREIGAACGTLAATSAGGAVF